MAGVSAHVCARCGRCCRWAGFVAIAPGEEERLAEFLALDVREFLDRFTVLRPDRRGLMLVPGLDDACVFLDDSNLCRVEPVKPDQCRAFPEAWTVPGWREQCLAAEAKQPSTL